MVQKRQYWRIVLVCFLAAATFWILNALNHIHTTRIFYPIRFVYDSRVLMPLHPLPTEVALNVTGKGWNLLRLQLGITETEPARLPIQNLPEATFLTGQTLAPAIRKELRGINLNFVATDTINFRFDRRVARQINITLDSSSLHLATGYRLESPVRIVPNKVTLTGPAFLLDTIPGKVSLRLPRKTISKDYKETVALPFLQNPLISADIKHTVISFEVAKQLLPDTTTPVSKL